MLDFSKGDNASNRAPKEITQSTKEYMQKLMVDGGLTFRESAHACVNNSALAYTDRRQLQKVTITTEPAWQSFVKEVLMGVIRLVDDPSKCMKSFCYFFMYLFSC